MNTASILISAVTISACATLAAPANQAKLPVSHRDFGPTAGRDEATREWLRSWHKGEVYATQADYLFEGNMEVESTEEANWLKRWAARTVSAVEKGAFFGKAIAKTFVYHEAPHLRLVRDYQYVNSVGNWGATATPKSQLIQKAIGKAAEKDLLGRKNRKAFYTGFSMIDPVKGALLAEWGDPVWEVAEDWLARNVGTFDNEGRLNITESSIIGKALDIDERKNMVAMAMAFSEGVNGRKIAMAHDGTYTRRTKEIKSLASAKADPYESVESFDTYLVQGSEASKELQALVKRESFSVMKDLFDSETRKPGDVWAIDASFFNSFLHPDLKGAFRGRAVVRYIDDQEGDKGYFSAPGSTTDKMRRYDVRRLEVIEGGKVDGSKVTTDFSYDERPMGGRFWAKYDSSNSNVLILVDKNSGHVVYGQMRLYADKVGALPSLKLMRGFRAAGDGSLTLTVCGDVFSAAELAGEVGK